MLSAVPLLDHRGHVRSLAAIMEEVIDHGIDACGGNVSAAARQLGISCPMIHRRLKESRRVGIGDAGAGVLTLTDDAPVSPPSVLQLNRR